MGKKRRVKKGLIVFLFLLISFGVGFLVYKKINYKKTPTPDKPEVIDSIDNFQYELNDNETKYYVELFNALKDLLKNEDYEEEQYALLVSKLFTADFYDLDSKIMKSDVGGTQFVYSDYRSDFENGAMDSMYKFIESNVYGDRKQELPVVKSINDISIEQKSFEYGDDIDFDAYYITLGINYEKNLDYPEEVLLVLIHNDDKLEVAKLETLKKD